MQISYLIPKISPSVFVSWPREQNTCAASPHVVYISSPERSLAMKSIEELSVLVVEDSNVQFETIRYYLIDELGLKGSNIDRSSDIASLPKIFSDQDILLLDLTLEDSEGIDTVKAVRKLFPSATVIVLTSTDDDELALLALREGAQDYIPKKYIDANVLKKSIRYALERDKLIQQLTSLNSELREANSIKNEFLGMAAHDLRTPLGQIAGFISLVYEQAEGNLDEESLGMLKTIQERSEFMLALVNDLLDVAKIESGKVSLAKEQADIIQLIDRTIALNEQFAAKKAITIARSYKKSSVTLPLDVQKIEQVFSNLLSNAIKYSHANTGITVNVIEESARIVVEVQDEGQGISQDELEQIFLPFNLSSTQATAGESSTGLGLVIVKNIVQAHNGEIDVESELGKGSKFWFSIPKN